MNQKNCEPFPEGILDDPENGESLEIRSRLPPFRNPRRGSVACDRNDNLAVRPVLRCNELRLLGLCIVPREEHGLIETARPRREDLFWLAWSAWVRRFWWLRLDWQDVGVWAETRPHRGGQELICAVFGPGPCIGCNY